MVARLRKRERYFYIILFLCIFTSLSFISAELNQTLDKQEAEACINISTETILEMNASGFHTQRISEILKQAQSMYGAQQVIEEKNKLNYDFSVVFSYCEEIKKIKELAFSSIESRDVLLKFYQSSITSEMDVTEINQTLEEINNEINSERYEKVDQLVSKAYEQISFVIASYSKLRAVYISASSGFLRFIYLNKYFLIIFFSIILIFWIIFYKKVRVYLIQKEIKGLELRKNTIKGLIMKSQREFFEKGSLSESNYNIRTKKFGELILDVDRQIPVLKEEISKLTKNKKDEKGKRIL